MGTSNGTSVPKETEMVQIANSKNVPDFTYFRTGDAEPLIRDNQIEVLNGQGSRRSSWGAPGVTSTVLVQSESFVAVHVGFHHKHGGGQFYRYFVVENDVPRRVNWVKLTNEQRQMVIDAPKPYWAKAPGKLRAA